MNELLKENRVKKRASLFFTIICLSAVFAHDASAEVRLPAIISDNMVLQQGMKLPIWGWANPGETVTVTIGSQKKHANADAKGQWRVVLDSFVSCGTHTMTVSGDNTLTVRNILVGEVWVCSGQSNMDFSLNGVRNAKEEMAEANDPEIRLFQVEHKVAKTLLSDCQGRWEICTPASVAHFSAVGYLFGRDLHIARNMPVGLIQTSYGGSTIEAWMRREVLEADSANKPLLEYWQNLLFRWAATEQQAAYEKTLAQWTSQAEEAKKYGKQAPPRPAQPSESVHQPCVLYNAMVAPLLQYGIKGVVWYQGEANTSGLRNFSDWYKDKSSTDVAHADRYQDLLTVLIDNWRKDWGEGDFTFLIVQLPNCGQPAQAKTPRDSNWGRLREAQLRTALSVPKTGIVFTVDTDFPPGDPDTGHPRHKQHVGQRLVLAARAIAYGEKIECFGPIYDSMRIEGSKIRLKFKHADSGLVAKGGTLKWFTVASQDQKFFWADAIIDGETVVVSSASILEPVAVRYAWDIDPTGCNLYGKNGLPASPFRTDQWPLTDKDVEAGNF